MLSKSVQKACLSSASAFNVLAHFKTLKASLTAPLRYILEESRPNHGAYEGSHNNLTYENFDDSAGFWHAYYSQHPFYLQVFQNLENLPTVQFGTVDNPVVVFTADAPFRYVGCTGLQNEDDYEQHELMLFMLKEGPLQRCPSCGQVFKLVRLLQQDSAEMEFYKNSFNPIDIRDSARVNSMPQLNPFKMNTHFEPNHVEDILQHNYVYDPIDIDLHQRLLVDPAYRAWRWDNLQIKKQIYDEAFQQATQELQATKPQFKTPVPKRQYENVLEAETALDILERHRAKVYRFYARHLLDVENHDRREQRMKARAQERWDNKYTYFVGGLTEEEQKYLDYFQTDQEIDPEDEMIEQKITKLALESSPGYKLDNFDFQEYYTLAPEDDQQSILSKKLFKFRYRFAATPSAELYERESRMVQRQLERLTQDPKRRNAFQILDEAHNDGNYVQKLLANANYVNIAAEEAFLCYKDFFEGDQDAQIELVESLYKANPHAFVPIYENHSTRLREKKGFVSIPKRAYDENLNVWNNFNQDLSQYVKEIRPLATTLSNRNKIDQIQPDEQALLEAIYDQAQQDARAQVEQQTQIEPPQQKPQPQNQKQQKKNKK